MSEFEIYRDSAGEYRWRLQADNGEIVAHSSEGYVNKGDCENGLQNFRNAFTREMADQHTIAVTEGEDGQFRWTFNHQNGNVIATGEGYSGEYEAERGVITALFHATDPSTGITDQTGN